MEGRFMILSRKVSSDNTTDWRDFLDTVRSGYRVQRMISAITGCMRRCTLNLELGIGEILGFVGNINLSIKDSSKRYREPVDDSTDKHCSFTNGLRLVIIHQWTAELLRLT